MTNPCSSVVIQIDEAAGEVEYFTPEQAAQIMTLSTSKRFLALLPFHAICMFSGVRTAECERLTWNNIDFDDKTIVLISAHAKTRGRRIAMSPNLVKWLEWFHTNYNQYPLTPSQGFRDKKRQFRKQLGLKWPSKRNETLRSQLHVRGKDWGLWLP